MKSALISIQPKWCEKILNGEKIIEVRKTRPNIETPFKCYIYCTIGDMRINSNSYSRWYAGNDIIYGNRGEIKNGKVIAEFVYDKIYDIVTYIESDRSREAFIQDLVDEQIENMTCLKTDEIAKYLDCAYGYGWRISDLKIYDTPKELGEFAKPCNKNANCAYCKQAQYNGGRCNGRITRPPQSWCYVEET